MQNMTKQALKTSLEKLLAKKPLDKITINDLTSDCGISRMTFYYHFKDIYDLVEWVCLEESRKALQGKKTYESWQEGLLQIFEAVYENKALVQNAFRSASRERIENYLFTLTHGLIMNVVEEQARDLPISEEHKAFIADFYKYSFIGIMLDWIKNGMRKDYREIADDTATALYGSIDNAIRNFAARNKTAEMHTE